MGVNSDVKNVTHLAMKQSRLSCLAFATSAISYLRRFPVLLYRRPVTDILLASVVTSLLNLLFILIVVVVVVVVIHNSL